MKIEYDGEGWPTLAFAGDGLDGADLDELAETAAEFLASAPPGLHWSQVPPLAAQVALTLFAEGREADIVAVVRGHPMTSDAVPAEGPLSDGQRAVAVAVVAQAIAHKWTLLPPEPADVWIWDKVVDEAFDEGLKAAAEAFGLAAPASMGAA